MKLPVWMVSLVASAALAQEKQMTKFDFESDAAGQPPKGFELALTGKGKPGKWVVQAVDDAPSGKNVLAQTDGDTTDYRFPIAYIDRGLSTLPGFLRTLSGAAFLDWGGAYNELDLRDPWQSYHVGVGGELRVDFSLVYNDDTELRIGLARGLDSKAPPGVQSYFVFAAGF